MGEKIGVHPESFFAEGFAFFPDYIYGVMVFAMGKE